MIARALDLVVIVLYGLVCLLLIPIVAPFALALAVKARLNRWLDEDEQTGSSCGGWQADLMGDMKGGCKR